MKRNAKESSIIWGYIIALSTVEMIIIDKYSFILKLQKATKTYLPILHT